MESQDVNCPSCGALNPGQGGRCEACGGPLGWALWKNRGSGVKWPKQLTAAACLVGGLALGALANDFLVRFPLFPTHVPVVAVSQTRPQLDVVFVIDTTGSMADEIEVVKNQVKDMMAKVQAGQPQPYVRFGIVAYRDRGDAYVTKFWPLTNDISQVQETVNSLVAEGGGDVPESVNEALHVGLEQMNWNYDQSTKRVLFLIGDAGPHMDYPNDFDYRNEMAFARDKGIRVNTWGCSGITECGEPEFREMAKLGNGEFQFLTYRQEVVKADGSKVNMLFQGDACYEATATADWKQGASQLPPTLCKAVPAGVKAPGSSSTPSYGRTCGYQAASNRLENNLDWVLVQQVMAEGRQAGVRY